MSFIYANILKCIRYSRLNATIPITHVEVNDQKYGPL